MFARGEGDEDTKEQFYKGWEIEDFERLVELLDEEGLLEELDEEE